MSLKVRSLFVGLVAAAAVVTTPAVSVQADTLPLVPWSSYLPGWTDTYIPSSSNDCVAGRDNCLKSTLKELADIFASNAQSCSHNAPFSLAYLRMTQTYGWSRDIPGYYQDVAFANHQDATFAKYYIDAFTNWQSGNRAAVPQAWLTAFDAAQNHALSGAGDLLLGMNAHINRDLPFVLAAVGLVAPDGSSRKPDFDKVEQWLYTATAPVNSEGAVRFDPAMDDAQDPLGLSYLSLFQIVSGWRENAWRNAEALVSAPTPAAPALVAANLENDANVAAQGIVTSFSYQAPLQSSASRDAYCSVHHDDAATMPYDFGMPQPYGYTY